MVARDPEEVVPEVDVLRFPEYVELEFVPVEEFPDVDLLTPVLVFPDDVFPEPEEERLTLVPEPDVVERVPVPVPLETDLLLPVAVVPELVPEADLLPVAVVPEFRLEVFPVAVEVLLPSEAVTELLRP